MHACIASGGRHHLVVELMSKVGVALFKIMGCEYDAAIMNESVEGVGVISR